MHEIKSGGEDENSDEKASPDLQIYLPDLKQVNQGDRSVHRGIFP